ncbi:MAG TPA: 50S ribosomal protein L7/L12, partial [Acidimicrobiales bacterium]
MATKSLSKDEILDAISNMTVLELSELLKDFEEKFGVSAAAPAAVAVAAPTGGEAAAEEEK